MGGRALSATPKHAHTAPITETETGTGIDNPGLRLLDALRAGDESGVLAVCGPTTTVSAENMGWSCRGREQIRAALDDARALFPGITFESRTRQVGFGLVIEEARARDVQWETAADDLGSKNNSGDAGEPDERSDHPMYDDPAFDGNPAYVVAPAARPPTAWRDASEDEPPAPLDLPLRVIVHHDDLQVHEVAFSFPAALLKRALGLRVDPFELSLSEVQSAFLAPVGAEPITRDLALPEPAPGASAPDAAPLAPEVVADRPRRRRRWVLVLLALLALVAAGAWWTVQGRGSDRQAAPAASSPAASTRPSPSPSLTSSPSADASQSQAPTVTHAKPTGTPSRTPNVTLRSDLAFGFNSATLSPEAKTAIDQVARQVVRAGLRGRIFVDGYTDSTGSAAYGVVLSRQRADAVSTYLQSRLLGAPVSIVSTGHGEAHPIADNASASGRKANRRVTITLPRG